MSEARDKALQPFGDLLLLGLGIKNFRAILVADIGPLTVRLGRIVNLEKELRDCTQNFWLCISKHRKDDFLMVIKNGKGFGVT